MGIILLFLLIVLSLIWLVNKLVNKIIGNSRTLLVKRLKYKGRWLPDFSFYEASKKYKDDLEIVKIAIQSWSDDFGRASERIRSDENIVLDLIDINPAIIKFSLIKTDKIFQKALAKDGSLIVDCPMSYRSNKNIVLRAIENIELKIILRKSFRNSEILYSLSDEIKNDRNIVLRLIKINPWNLISALEIFKNDREIVKEALCRNGGVLSYVSETLKDDIELVELAINHYKHYWTPILALVSERLRGDRGLVKTAIMKYGGNLEYASILLRKDFELCILAIKNDYHAFQFVSESLKNDVDFVIEALKINSNIKEYLNEEIKNNLTIRNKIKT